MSKIFSSLSPRLYIGVAIVGFGLLTLLVAWQSVMEIRLCDLALLTLIVAGSLVYSRWFVSMALVGLAAVILAIVALNFNLITFDIVENELLLVVSGIVGWWLAQRVRAQEKHNQNQLTTISNLAYFDAGNGILNHHYLRSVLDYEVERARRYNHPLVVVCVRVSGHEKRELAVEEFTEQDTVKEMTKLLSRHIRTVDQLSLLTEPEPSWIIVMPDTDDGVGQILIKRLEQLVKTQLGLGLIVGVATFPHDGIDGQTLLDEANAAVEFGCLNTLNVVSRNLLNF